MKVLVYIDQRDGQLKNNGFELLTAARQLSPNAADVSAVIVGDGVDSCVSELAGYGADQVFVASHIDLSLYNVMNYAAAVQTAIDSFKPDLVLGSASPMGRDLFPRLAARNNSGLLTDVVKIEDVGGELVATKPLYAGKCLGKFGFAGDGIKFATLRPNSMAAEKNDQGSATAQALDVSLPEAKIKTVEVRKGASQKADLTEASLIISGGRAMGSAENFKILEECAETFGATVGASRAAVDSGYAPHDMQVGQTGKTVNPNLYIACGISGSIQHMAGMRTSKTIVAINTDPDAPIFTVADYGIVADLFEAVPVLTQKLKELNL
ncbi:electron transfer flavoprotein subunit alpha/FixB family protein [Pseudobacteriovorax antillogorgiicola]|uniref:Electron transfer flavoprotein subunit alpha n=1 Tax=Pseudobacteriovorax antillogorgiicola TaxID=1513793 RepID=A0A1Y6B3R6_9BACT|nr:electron transfer flavoprotein subunit alpha/FixB family protein [Pseudobacteriovorax antillogorgiicola]TCS59416.1 electron transfer flavoprotein alpha subunit apoprotein [Pseudobacteriovorax antillogorgiicola]SME88493.1 electron transfer flavoprotein alpha subunit apoprotein [Pseudobacteriovorax antillogorgiicola]